MIRKHLSNIVKLALIGIVGIMFWQVFTLEDGPLQPSHDAKAAMYSLVVAACLFIELLQGRGDWGKIATFLNRVIAALSTFLLSYHWFHSATADEGLKSSYLVVLMLAILVVMVVLLVMGYLPRVTSDDD